MKKIAITTLGCDKNTCDSEALAGALRAAGHTLVASDEEAEIIVVNTCAFIKSARDEAIKVIKSKFKYNAEIVVTGCMTKYKDLIPNGVEIWEIGQYSGQKLLSTPKSYAYIKIADGCNNCCSYCTIPSIRGRYVSRAEDDILSEIRRFASLGVGEFILVAQDLTKYKGLVGLIQETSKINGVQRIRLHYVYPNGITDELLNEIASNPKVCKYVDIPLQHVSPRILKLMNRKADDYSALIKKLRENVTNIKIRSTFMIGFPTEAENDFNMLCEFLREARLDYVGFFAYSREAGTPAYSMQQVSNKTKSLRLNAVQRLQNNILVDKHQKLVGTSVKVVCDFYDDMLGCSITRSEHQSPEVDPVIIVKSKLKVGEYADIKIIGIEDENLIGEKI